MKYQDIFMLYEGETKSEYKLRKAIGRKSHEEITKEIFNWINIHLVKAKCISLYKTVFLKKTGFYGRNTTAYLLKNYTFFSL